MATDTNNKPLFRQAALEATKVKWLGEIVLIRPLSFTVLTVIAAVMTMLLVAFIALGSYTKRTTVAGQLVPDMGVVKVFAPQLGIVLEKHVREGQVVKKGDVLYIISSERQNSNEDGIQAAISRQVALRQQSLRDELAQTQRLQRDQVDALRKKVDALAAEQANVSKQLASQRIRVELAQANVRRTKKLLSQGYISAEMSQQKEADLLDQQSRLQALERDLISVERELQVQQNELATLPLQHRNQLAQIERLLISTNQEWTESEGKRRVAITAPEAGTATAITAELGQNVDGAKPLVSIVPRGATLQAYLYAPSRSIGFIRPGDEVLLRYQAYPYQKFGHAPGKVASVSLTAMSSSELTAEAGNGEAFYRITVDLSSQTILAYGKAQDLQAGMLVDADILQERRQLYEWVLEPLFSLTGKL
jgi:membrane fusion protein